MKVPTMILILISWTSLRKMKILVKLPFKTFSVEVHDSQFNTKLFD